MVEGGKVQIIIGSKSDRSVLKGAIEILEELGVGYYLNVASAHRSPKRVVELSAEFEKRGVAVVIACAGLAAHLPGVVAANTTLPVIGVPIDAGPLGGIDALLSIAQMPPGIPVGCMGIGAAGAKNAALLAVEIIGLQDKGLEKRLKRYRQQLSQAVLDDDLEMGE